MNNHIEEILKFLFHDTSLLPDLVMSGRLCIASRYLIRTSHRLLEGAGLLFVSIFFPFHYLKRETMRAGTEFMTYD